MRKWVTTSEAALMLNESKKLIAIWCLRGKMKAKKNRGCWLIDADSLGEYVQHNSTKDSTPPTSVLKNILKQDDEKKALLSILDSCVKETERHKSRMEHLMKMVEIRVSQMVEGLDI